METFLLENQADQLFAELSPATQLRWSKWRLTFRDAGTEQTLFLLLWFRLRRFAQTTYLLLTAFALLISFEQPVDSFLETGSIAVFVLLRLVPLALGLGLFCTDPRLLARMWSPATVVIMTIFAISFHLDIFLCTASDSGYDCRTAAQGSVPWLVMATSTAVPWICVVVFRARWHHVLLSSIVILVSAGVFVVSSLELDGQNPMSWMIFLFINGCMAAVNHRCFEKEIRSTFRREAATRRKLGSMTEASALYLLEVERSLRMGELMRYSPLLFWELDKDGVVQSASPAAADLLGLSQFQAIKKSFYRFVHPVDRDIVRREMESLVGKSRNFLRITYRRLRLDGSEFFCESVAHTVERKGHDTIVFVIDRDCSYDSEKDRKNICTVPHLGGWSGPNATSSDRDPRPTSVLTSARPSLSAGPDACDAMREVTQALYCNALQLAAPQQCLSTALSTLESLITPSPDTSHDVSTEQVLATVGPIVAGVKLVLQQAQWLQTALETFVAGVQQEFDMAGGVTSAGLKALLYKGCTGVRQTPPEAKPEDKKRPPRSTTEELILLCPGLKGEDLPVTSIVQEVVSLLGLSFSGTLHSSPSLETVSGVWSRASQGGVQILPEVTLRVLAPGMQSICTDRSWLRQLMCDSVIRMVEAQRHLPLVTQTVSDTGTDNMNLSLPQPTVILLVSPLPSPDSPEDASSAPGVRITVALPVAATASSEEVQQALARARGRNPAQYVAGLRAAADRLNCAAAAVSVRESPPRGVEVSETMLAHRWLTWWFDIRPMKEAAASELLPSAVEPKYLSVLTELASPGRSAGTAVMSMSPAPERARVTHPSPNITSGAVRPRNDRAATPPMSKPMSTPGQPTHAITPASKPRTTQTELAGMRVLFVDDEIINRRLGSKMLLRMGCDCITLEDGDQVQDAISTATSQGKPFDVVIMDIFMERTDGADVCADLRRSGLTSIPMIAMSGATTTEDVERYLRAGFNLVLAKPFGIKAMRRALLETRKQ